jgi:hypothetical protein
MSDHTIRGQVVSETGLRPLSGLRVEAWDCDQRIDKRLGTGTTDANGTFEIVVDEAHREDLLERQPDIYFKVFRDQQTLAHTRTQVLWSFRDPHVRAIIPVGGGYGGNGQAPPQSSSVEGMVTTEEGRAVTDVRIEVWDQRLGKDALIASGATDPKGHYAVHYKPSELGEKRAANLWVRALDPQRQRTELARSDVIYQAGPAIVVNLTVAADQVSRPSEYARLLAAAQPVLAGTTLRDLDAKGVALVANLTRWDARTVAMAAQAARLSQETKIPAEHYYALLRAGVPGDRAALHRLPDASVEQTLKQAMASGVIGNGHPIDATITIHRKESGNVLRQFKPSSAMSSLGDMLALSLDQDKSTKFLEAYHATADQPAALWSTLAARGFDASLIARLQADGKFGYLTRQNAPLIARLRERVHVATAEDLVGAGLYRASAWKSLVGSDVPPQIKADAYAAGLAAQVSLSYPTLVAAEMVRRGEITVDVLRDGGDGEVAAFLRAGHGKYAIGVDPIKRWDGFSRLSAQGRDGARLVERLYQLSPSNESMIALHREGLNSAFQIASQPKEQFLSRHGRAFPDQTEAELVYRKAQEIHATVLNMTTMYMAYRGSPNVYAMTGMTAKSSPDFSNVPGTPTLEDLLGDMDYCACDQCKSVLGAAAYFVELLQFIDVAHVPAGKRNPIDVLVERRPDLQHLLLSCENTNVALPYIDIVNEVLEFFVVNGNLATFAGYNMREDSATADLLADPEYVKDAAYDSTKDAVYPHPLPFDMPLAALRLLMRAWDTTLADALAIFGTPAEARREVLALNAPELDILTNTGFRTLPQYFGLAAAATIAQVNAAVAEGKAFCRTVDISYQDLVGILRTRFINPGAPLVPLLQQLSIPLAQLQSWYTDVIDDAALRALLPATIDPAQYGGDVLTWLHDNRSLIMGLITLTDTSAGAVECSFATVELRFALPDSAANRLDALAYWKLLRFIRLWKKLGWSLELTDTLVMTFLSIAPELLTMGNLDATFGSLIARIANFSTLLTRQAVSSKKIADWLAIWDTAATADVRRERLAHLLRIGATDLANFIEITGIDPLADDMTADTPSILRFLDEWKALKGTGLKIVDANYLLRNRDDGNLIAPTEAAMLRDLKALRDALTAIEADIGTPPDNVDLAYARSKLALVYDASVVDRFVGLISGGTTYRAPLPTAEEALPAKLSAVDTHLGFDPFEKVLTHSGILSAATKAAIGGAADTLVLDDMSVITAPGDLTGYIAAVKTAAQALVDSGVADLQQLNADYPELKLAYDAVAAITDPTAQAKALVDQILPTLRDRLKKIGLRATLASQLKTDAPLVDVLTEGATIVHATGDVMAGVLQDFRDLEKLAPLAADGLYRLHLDPPSTDEYIAYVAAPAGTTVTLTIDGVAAIPATVVAARGEVQSAVALPLTSGALVSAVLTLAGLPAAHTAELRWRTKGMAKTPIAASRVYADDRIANARASLLRLQKTAALLRAVASTPHELRHLASVNPDTRGFIDALDTDGSIGAANLHTQWARISWLAWFGKLKADEPEPDTWVGLLEQPGRLTPQGRLVLAAAAEWTDQDLTDVLTRFGLALADLTPLHVFRRVKDAVDFVVATQRTAAQLIAWTTASPDATLIATIKAALRAQQISLAWRTTLQSVNDPLRNARRDALVAYILYHARPAPTIDTADKLYEHFLIDCEMDACMATSRIRLALSTVQLFVTRCLMNLEHDVAASSIRADQWEWMKRYRVWEANRKIFLYPENWLAPELRDNKSPFFRELESELLKSDITDELAEDAYLAYLKKLDEVAYLEILGGYLQEGEAGNQDDDILHVFGRTNGNTHQYYYRRYECGYWTPWEKITLSIEGDLLFPVIWKSQLFVFWLSPVHKPDGADPTEKPADMGNEAWGDKAKVTAELNICWGEYYKGKWTSPKSSELKEPLRFSGLDKFEPRRLFVAARKEKPSPDVSERLVMTVGYLDFSLKFFTLTFTTKNAPPRIESGADSSTWRDVAWFDYILGWQPQPNALFDSNALRGQGKTLKVTITPPSGASSIQRNETILTKVGPLANGFRVRTLMHPVENQWEAPIFYNDEHSIFFISPDERVELVAEYTGYFWNDIVATIPPANIWIPPLYERPVKPDPIGPISNPLIELIHPNYDLAISDNNAFVFAGTAFDARGIATKGAMS